MAMEYTGHTLTENLKEKATHGDIFLPLRRYTSELTPLHPSVPLHWHEELEFARIMEGCARYQIGQQDFTVQEGDLLLIQPHMLHSAAQIDRTYMRSETFVFHMNFLAGSAADACSFKYFTPLAKGTLFLPNRLSCSHPHYEAVDKVFKQIYDCYEKQDYGYELALKTYFFDLFRLLFQNGLVASPERTDSSFSHSEKLKKILQYIQLHFAEELSVAGLAEFCHLSPYYFMHFFKENTGMTFVEYLNSYRLRQAAMMLEKGDYSIIDAALGCGFNNISYFHKKFREYYGMTPKMFIQSARQT